MTVIIEKSICSDCVWKDTCQRLERVNNVDKRNNPGHTKDIFDVVILRCSLKNFDRSYKDDEGNVINYLYYCTKCGMMHRSNSRIGISHKNGSSK